MRIAGQRGGRQISPRVNQPPSNIQAVAGRDFFLTLALIYLALPNVVFISTWLRPQIGIPAAVIVAFCVFRLVKFSVPKNVSPLTIGLVLTAALFWMLFGGVGGVLPQSSDYIKHNLLFHDLVVSAWPVNYSGAGAGKNYLCYGLGYYLMPALGGKMFGAAMVPLLSFAWTFAGLALFFFWVATFDHTPGKTLPLFLGFAVTGIVWLQFKQHGIPGLISADGLEIKLKQLGLYFSYNDSFTRFQYQPHHALTGWLGAALLYEMLCVKKNPAGVFFVWTMCLLWSPLSCIGLLLVPLAALNRVHWQYYFEPVNLIGGGVLLAIMGIYFQGHVPLAESGAIWKFSSGAEWVAFYFLFLALELSTLLFIFLLERKYRLLGDLRPLFFIGAIFLLLLPLWKMGHNSDLRMEASAPALLFAALAAGRCFQSGISQRPLMCGLIACLLIGAIYPIMRPWRIFHFHPKNFSYETIVQLNGYKNLSELRDLEFNSSLQYLGRPDSAAARWLLR